MKMRTLSCLLVCATFWLMQSCSIATTIHFNKNYSGTYKTVVDMSELISMTAMFDTTGTMTPEMAVEEMRKGLDSMGLAGMYNGMSGIRDAVAEVDDQGVMTVAFSFDNLESLTQSFKTMQERTAGEEGGALDAGGMDMLPTELLGGGGEQVFSSNGKTLMHSFGLGDGALTPGDEEMENMDMVASMMDYTIDFSFDRKVKSVEMEGLTLIEQGKNVVKTRVDFAKMLGEGYKIEVTTK